MKLTKLFLIATLTLTFGLGVVFASPAENAQNTNVNSMKDSPETATKEFIQSYLDKDTATFKKRSTKSLIKVMQDFADAKNITLDEAVKQFMDSDSLPFTEVPVMRNSKIDGKTATIELNVEDKWEEFKLVMEDNLWKVSFM